MLILRLFVLYVIALVFGICLISPAMAAESISIQTDSDTIYLGDQITFSGSNFNSDKVYLFIAGPNLPFIGGNLSNPRTPVINGLPSSFISTDVLGDRTWAYTWQTTNFEDCWAAYGDCGCLNLDPGSYTMYAVETPNDIDHLGNTHYSIQSITILADTREYPQMPDNTAGEDSSTDNQPPTAIPGNKINIISSANSGVAYLGDEITFSGSNLNSDKVYLFITGPNLPQVGGNILDPREPCDKGYFVSTDVRVDHTWEYKWQTANLNIDPSTYTIYAVAAPCNKSNLINTQYATASISIRRPFLSASMSRDVIAAGDQLFITGVARGNPSPGVGIWIFGNNKILYTTESVNPDGSFSHEVTEATTQSLSNGEYSVVVQHPMSNDVFDVFPWGGADRSFVDGSFPNVPSRLFQALDAGSLPSSVSLVALVNDLNNPNIDDRYIRLKFVVGEPSLPPLTGDYLSSDVQPSITQQGGKIYIRGNAKGNPATGIAIWILGKDSFKYDIAPVNRDSSFEYEVPTNNLPNGEYSVVVQHPMYNSQFDVYPNVDNTLILGTYPVGGSTLFNLQELSSVSQSLTVAALVSNLQNPNTDDIYKQLKFIVGAPASPPVEQEYLSASVQSSTIAPGEKIRIIGSARGNPTQGVAIWIFGKNKIIYGTVGIKADSTFEYDISDSITKDLASGEYSVVVQHPMYNDQFDVFPGVDVDMGFVDGSFPYNPSRLFKLEGAGSLSSSSALLALISDLNNPNIDDRHEQLNFVVGTTATSPAITSLNPNNVIVGGNSFTLEVTGTNFATGAKVLWQGQERQTVFVSSTKLSASILKEDVATVGSYKIKVVNPDKKESNEYILKVNEDIPVSTYPKVDTFYVTPSSGPSNQKFTISGTVSAGEGSTLLRVELWRNDVDPSNQNDWKKIDPVKEIPPGRTTYSYSFEDTPGTAGDHWYGIHVVDGKTWAHEGGGQDRADGKPKKVTVTSKQVHVSIKVYDSAAKVNPLPSVKVTGHDGANNSIDQTTDSNGIVSFTGAAGSWHFILLKEGYSQIPWDDPINSDIPQPLQAYMNKNNPSSQINVVTDQVTKLTLDSARLNGHIEDSGEFTVWFNYDIGSKKFETSKKIMTGPGYFFDDLTRIDRTQKIFYRAYTTKVNAPDIPSKGTLGTIYPITARIPASLLSQIDAITLTTQQKQNWGISEEQIKIIIAALAWGEGGSFGYAAHSSDPRDIWHKDLPNNFHFSEGLGPFQITNYVDGWTTRDKLNSQMALKETLLRHTQYSGGNYNNLEDVRKKMNGQFFAYDENIWKNTWSEVTGTEWDLVKNSNKESNKDRGIALGFLDKQDITWNSIREQLTKNELTQPWISEENAIQNIGNQKWTITESDNIFSAVDKTKKIILQSKSLPTWIIHAKKRSGGVKTTEYFYYYTYDTEQEIEILAYLNPSDTNHDKKSIFTRSYTKPLAKQELPDSNGMTLQHDAIELNQNDLSAFTEGKFIFACPVDGEVIDPDGLIINKSFNSIPDAAYSIVLGEDNDSGIEISIRAMKEGSYLVNVVPTSDAKSNDTFSLKIVQGNSQNYVTKNIADNTKISEIPKIPYIYSSHVISWDYSINASFRYGETNQSTTIEFIDSSTGNIISRQWSFGDATFAENVTKVTHNYAIPGNYTVTLTASNSADSISTTKNITINNESEESIQLFTINATSGVNGAITPTGSIQVDSGSNKTFIIRPDTGQLSCWGGGTRYVIWNITVDGQTLPREGEPSLMPVNYTFTNISANHTIHAEFAEMIIDAKPQVEFSADISSGLTPLTVHFTQVQVSNNTGQLWSFGDNSTSTEQNPTHTYANPGQYNVSLKIFCERESFIEEKPNYIKVSNLPPIGGNIGYYLIHSNVNGAQVYFDNDFKGNISNGLLNVSIYVTGTPYRTITVKMSGYNDYTENLNARPSKDETIDIYANLILSGFFNFNFNFVSFPSFGVPFSEFKEFNFSFFQF